MSDEKKSKPPLSYQVCLGAFARAVGDAVTVTVKACRQQDTRKDVEPNTLLDSLKHPYNSLVKPMYAEFAEDALEQELGIIYGSMIVCMQAIHASWLVHSSAKGTARMLTLEQIRNECSEFAHQRGKLHIEKARERALKLTAQEMALGQGAEYLCALLAEHAHRLDLRYISDSSRVGSTEDHKLYGHAPTHFFIAEKGRTKVRIEFTYWDGADYCPLPLGLLYNEPTWRNHLAQMADMAFGQKVRFSSDYSWIEL